MEITILGSGSATASAERGPSGHAIREGDTSILVDAGSGTLGRLCRAGLSPARLSALLFTHIHPDHVADLVPVLFEIKHGPGERRREDLPIVGPADFRGFVDRLMEIFGQWCIGEEYDLDVVELERGRMTVGSLAVRTCPVAHTVPTVAYRIENPAGIAVVLTGDTEPCDDLVELARAADVLISDSSLSGGEVLSGHMSAAQAGALAREAGVRTLILSHLAPEKRAADLVAEARAAFPGQVVAAYDLLSIVL